jgi:hypothetical protein
MNKRVLLENKLRKMIRREISEERTGFLRDSDISSHVDACMKKLEDIAGDDDSIKIAESIVDYLNRKYIRYKKSYEKFGK